MTRLQSGSKKNLVWRGLACALLGLTTLGAAASETLPAFNTYQAVPFVVGAGGLASDMVAYLNDKLKGKYHFELNQVAREKLNQNLDQDSHFKGVVLFLNPLFVGDPGKTKYHWTPPIIADSNVVISLNSKKLEYVNGDSLKGLKFAGIAGNHYPGLDERFGKDIQRENANEELSNLRKVSSGKADVTIMAASIYHYLLKQLGEQSPVRATLYTSAKPQASFDRYLFSSSADAALAKELDAVVGGMKLDPAWKTIAAKYGLD